MEIFYESRQNLLKKSAIALGFFDGVHLGHQAVISAVIDDSKLKNITSAVVTFKDHPRVLTQGTSPLLLTTIEQRLQIFEKMGIEAVLVLTFTEELCRLSPREYVETVLVNCMGAKLISVGYNHHFGRQREGDAQLLKDFGKSMGFDVQVTTPVYVEGIEVSSSKIRECLETSNLQLANKLLSRPYSITGKVVSGDGRGSQLGFPTANLQVGPYQMLPAKGVYAAKVCLYDQPAQQVYHNAVVNIGSRPTFSEDNNAPVLVEVHLLNFKDDLYDKKMAVYFHKYLRSEMKFASVDDLKVQISKDCKSASELFSDLTSF